jgi:hypothetical protein
VDRRNKTRSTGYMGLEGSTEPISDKINRTDGIELYHRTKGTYRILREQEDGRITHDQQD